MADGGGSGSGEVVSVSPRARQPRGWRRRHKASAACLPLDVIVEEIAARSDAATLVRCAATCRDARRRIAEDPNPRGRLRLRDTGRFLLPLLRGHLAGITTYDYESGRRKTTAHLVVVDTTAADTTRLVEATLGGTETLRNPVPVDSRGGLVLVRATATSQAHPWQRRQHDYQLLVVCNPATRRRQELPTEPAFPLHLRACESAVEQYVLLVGGGAAVGRSFQVLKTMLMLSKRDPSRRRLMVHTFSSEHGTWSPLMEIPTPNIDGGCICWAPPTRKVLVVGDVVHWLCLTDVWSYVLTLDVKAARVSETALPVSFPHPHVLGTYSYLLAKEEEDSAGGSPIVFVADAKNKTIRAWEQCKSTKLLWKARPQVVIEWEAIMGFNDDVAKMVVDGEEGTTRTMCGPELLWFGERSGVVLIRFHGCCLLWLDLHSNKIVRCLCFSSSDPRMKYAQEVYCPYEQDHSSWVPTFSNAAVTI